MLLTAEGLPGNRLAAMVGCAEPTVVTWRARYAEHGLGGLKDLPWPGKPAQPPEELRDRVLQLTLTEPPTAFGGPHWSSRLLAAALAGEGRPISHAPVARIWRRFGVQPWRAQTFTFSTDPALEGQVPRRRRAVPASAGEGGVLCGDEKPQIQALQRTARTLPVRHGHPEAASSTTSGTAPPRCSARSRWPPGG